MLYNCILNAYCTYEEKKEAVLHLILVGKERKNLVESYHDLKLNLVKLLTVPENGFFGNYEIIYKLL